MSEEKNVTGQRSSLLYFHFRPAAISGFRVQLHDSSASKSRLAEFLNFRYDVVTEKQDITRNSFHLLMNCAIRNADA
ncbi:hypothetical protein X777_07464 [Ooceraea biroi]|uniref:Uncharacterized protein n=1 Tax=Ooceraea biroi TaxID=2015173 RepID=A0A026X302_OOCBI|nr:hypothetical protein X777_07464 [Ooceraea biroi]